MGIIIFVIVGAKYGPFESVGGYNDDEDDVMEKYRNQMDYYDEDYTNLYDDDDDYIDYI